MRFQTIHNKLNMKAVYKILIALAAVLVAIQFFPSGMPENKPEDKNSIVHSNLISGLFWNR